MDTLTHTLAGVLLARALPAWGGGLSHARRQIACGVGAAFPDVDFALQLLAPQVFLNLHRGPTHSLVLLPAWAALLALALTWLWRRRDGGSWRALWPPCVALCALGLGSHIAGDWVTLYGTRLFYPVLPDVYALELSWDFNPWIALLVLVGALLGFARAARGPTIARATLLLVVLLLAAAVPLRRQALDLAQRDAPLPAEVWALPQPLSPFHWHLIQRQTGGYRAAFVDLLAPAGGAEGVAAPAAHSGPGGYRARDDLIWRRHDSPETSPLSLLAWNRAEIGAFRAFARIPALYRIDEDPRATCVWFADLRHALPLGPPPFRQGLCRAGHAPEWRLHRLRYFSEDRRQAL